MVLAGQLASQVPKTIARIETDFFARFAQRGGGGVGIPCVHLAAGKGDLARMVFQMRGAFGQDDLIADHTDQDGG